MDSREQSGSGQVVSVRYTDLAGNLTQQSFNIDGILTALAEVRIELTDLNGEPITAIGTGRDFLARVFVKDTRGL